MPATDVFVTRAGAPRLARCAVLFLDLLGVSAMNRGPARDVQRRLRDLDRAVTDMYRDYLSPASPLPAAFFSDALVLASPVGDDGDEAAVAELISHAALLQLNLATSDFFVRGGLSIGLFHIRDGLIFGPALVDAYELESRSAVNPRIVLSKAAEKVAPRPSTLLNCDGDGCTFINYLDPLFDDVEDPAVILEAHRDRVVARLGRRDKKRVWEKYRWVAEYHNAFVRRELPEIDEALVPTDDMTWRFASFA